LLDEKKEMETKITEYKTLRKSTSKLIEGPEGYEVDFKENISGLKSKTLVAFANSNLGGTILIGVREVQESNGVQRGQIIGCSDVGDGTILKIHNKAKDCRPSITVDVTIENLNKNPIIRIDIKSSSFKPHCTGDGTYSIRKDRHEKGLFPDEILTIFLEKEGEQFLSRFSKSVRGLERLVDEMSTKFKDDMEMVKDDIFDMAQKTEEKLEEISGAADDSRDNSEEASGNIEEVLSAINNMDDYADTYEIQRLGKSLDAIISHLGVDDPNKLFKLKECERIAPLIGGKGKKGKIAALSKIFPSLDNNEISQIVDGIK